MKAVGERNAGKPPVAFDEEALSNIRALLYSRIDTSMDRGEFLAIAYSLESHSNHPVARAITVYCRKDGVREIAASDVRENPGSGKQGMVDGHRIVLERSKEARESAVSMTVDGVPAGTIYMEYRIREGVSRVVETLKDMGIKVSMVSGDRKTEVESVARSTGIETYEGECTPEDKARIIQGYQEKGEFVAFVGDGINDAVVMETSDAGNIILAKDDISLVVDSVEMARLSMRKIRQNIGWAIGYNSILIPVAGGILVPAFGLGIYSFLPMLSALAMGLSSASVVLNSLMLKRSFRIARDINTQGTAASGA